MKKAGRREARRSLCVRTEKQSVWDLCFNRGKGYILRQIQVERRGSISKQTYNSRLSTVVIRQSCRKQRQLGKLCNYKWEAKK